MITHRRTIFWVFLLSGLVAFALAMSYRWFERGGAFDLDTVRIRGIRQADSSDVCAAVRSYFGTSIWRIDPSELEGTVEEIPGVDNVTVSREPFTGIILRIELAQPVFAVSDSSGTIPISSRGERLPVSFLTDTIPVVESHFSMDSSVSAGLASWFEREEIEWCLFSFRYIESGLSMYTQEGCEILLGFQDLSRRWRDFQLLRVSLSDIEQWQQIDMRYSDQAVLRVRRPEIDRPGGES